jgi:hypothetical protein
MECVGLEAEILTEIDGEWDCADEIATPSTSQGFLQEIPIDRLAPIWYKGFVAQLSGTSS